MNIFSCLYGINNNNKVIKEGVHLISVTSLFVVTIEYCYDNAVVLIQRVALGYESRK